MKKNDVMGYVVYAIMLGAAVGVGFGVIQKGENLRNDLVVEESVD